MFLSKRKWEITQRSKLAGTVFFCEADGFFGDGTAIDSEVVGEQVHYPQ